MCPRLCNDNRLDMYADVQAFKIFQALYLTSLELLNAHNFKLYSSV
jgi:hypothetical protein